MSVIVIVVPSGRDVLSRPDCCEHPESCDHEWCDVCDDWSKDTGGRELLSCCHDRRARVFKVEIQHESSELWGPP